MDYVPLSTTLLFEEAGSMKEFEYLTRDKISPYGRQRVYFTCHPEDFDIYFEEISKIVLKSSTVQYGIIVNQEGTALNPAASSAGSLPGEAQGIIYTSGDQHGTKTSEGITVPPGKLAGCPFHCRVCDNIVFSGAHFCPYCGCPVVIEKPDVKLQKVEFSAIAPKTLVKGAIINANSDNT